MLVIGFPALLLLVACLLFPRAVRALLSFVGVLFLLALVAMCAHS
jgi:hypothetical protein